MHEATLEFAILTVSTDFWLLASFDTVETARRNSLALWEGLPKGSAERHIGRGYAGTALDLLEGRNSGERGYALFSVPRQFDIDSLRGLADEIMPVAPALQVSRFAWRDRKRLFRGSTLEYSQVGELVDPLTALNGFSRYTHAPMEMHEEAFPPYLRSASMAVTLETVAPQRLIDIEPLTPRESIRISRYITGRLA